MGGGHGFHLEISKASLKQAKSISIDEQQVLSHGKLYV